MNRCGCCRKPLKDEQEFRWELCKDCQSVIAHLDQEVGVPASAGLKV